MAVPIDYGNPTGESITIRMARLKSTNNGTAPLGTLLINLGGPGAPTAALIKDVAKGNQLFSEELMANYDIVGLDPRGVGTSNPVKCNQRIWNERVNLFPTTEEEYQSIVAHNKALGESCAKLTGNLINHLDTAHVVEDFEMFRLAINNGGLNLLAWSYGTQIAIQYAEKYPENVNRFVLDGITDHTLPETTTLIAEAATYEATLNQFFLWCNTTSDCLLQGQNVAGLFDSLVKTAASSPIPAPNCNSTGDNACFSTITASDILTNVQFLLAGPNINTTWPELSSSLAAAAQGNAGPGLSTPIATSDNYNGYAFLAIACQDWLHESSGVTDVLEKQRMAAAMFPHTRGASESYYAQVKCIGWPALTTNPQHVLEKKALRAPPMLLVNALWDPETSIVWATGVARQLEETGSVLVTRDGAGHTSYLGSLEGETRGVEEVFLLTGVLPAKGLVLRS
ncbi:alpha/beta-hydrolase [Lindgomyces ingoldianus]|uniref:Alpha/beta-hydrolase n=1 Tax=Lindgomyces ingoldianus TaxID=673940 RepID=A0ACB6Q8B1_9PLEO|nr:alpha/beta-hydrolase [Lindgomyces ingoldianus]KAF2462612.1 alpha/beta-hydrolase [Lindgomyces ingoldianus]